MLSPDREHQITIGNLKAILAEFPDDVVLEVNGVDNLLILQTLPPGAEYTYQALGYIDLAEERIEWFDVEPPINT
jgi:hypothetical protein